MVAEDIAEQRWKCLQLRRREQQVWGRAEATTLAQEQKAAKKNLTKAIRESKECCWKPLYEKVNEEPCGVGYN